MCRIDGWVVKLYSPLRDAFNASRLGGMYEQGTIDQLVTDCTLGVTYRS